MSCLQPLTQAIFTAQCWSNGLNVIFGTRCITEIECHGVLIKKVNCSVLYIRWHFHTITMASPQNDFLIVEKESTSSIHFHNKGNTDCNMSRL